MAAFPAERERGGAALRSLSPVKERAGGMEEEAARSGACSGPSPRGWGRRALPSHGGWRRGARLGPGGGGRGPAEARAGRETPLGSPGGRSSGPAGQEVGSGAAGIPVLGGLGGDFLWSEAGPGPGLRRGVLRRPRLGLSFLRAREPKGRGGGRLPLRGSGGGRGGAAAITARPPAACGETWRRFLPREWARDHARPSAGRGVGRGAVAGAEQAPEETIWEAKTAPGPFRLGLESARRCELTCCHFPCRPSMAAQGEPQVQFKVREWVAVAGSFPSGEM